MYLFLQIALHVSGDSSAHHQGNKTVNIASGIVKPIPLPAAITDETQLQFNLIHDSSRQQYWFDNT
jgi:hypothetical protein